MSYFEFCKGQWSWLAIGGLILSAYEQIKYCLEYWNEDYDCHYAILAFLMPGQIACLLSNLLDTFMHDRPDFPCKAFVKHNGAYLRLFSVLLTCPRWKMSAGSWFSLQRPSDQYFNLVLFAYKLWTLYVCVQNWCCMNLCNMLPRAFCTSARHSAVTQCTLAHADQGWASLSKAYPSPELTQALQRWYKARQFRLLPCCVQVLSWCTERSAKDGGMTRDSSPKENCCKAFSLPKSRAIRDDASAPQYHRCFAVVLLDEPL